MKGSHTLIVPYVGHVLGSLMKLLNDPSSAVVGAALSTIGKNMGIGSEQFQPRDGPKGLIYKDKPFGPSRSRQIT